MISVQPIIRCSSALSFQCTGIAEWNVERKSTKLEIDTNMCSSCLPRYIKRVINDELNSLVILPINRERI